MKTRLAAVVATALALACAPNNASLELYGICAPPDSCTFTAKCDEYTLNVPTLDVATSLYGLLTLTIEVRNQLPDNSNEAAGKLNTNDAFVQEYEVEWEGTSLANATGRMQQVVPAGGSAVVAVSFAPPQLEGSYVAKLKLRGVYGDQSAFATAAMEIPVSVCNGCLADQSTCTTTCPPQSAGQLPISCGTTAP